MSHAKDQRVERTYTPLPEELMEGMNQLRINQDLFDVTVIVGNKPFQAHKAVLASLSGYFQVMFTNRGFVDMKKSEIQIKEEGLSPESFDQLLEFMYTSKVAITSIERVIDLLQVAGFLQVNGAVTLCVDYLKEVVCNQSISFEMAHDLSCIANRLDHPDLKNLVDRYVGQNMVEFIKTPEFLEQMPALYLEELLKREDLNETTSEDALLEVVVAWLQFDWDARKTNTISLLQNIRFGVIPNHNISDILGEEIEAIAKEIINKEDDICSTHRGTLTVILGDIKASFQVVRKDQERQGFRNATTKDMLNPDVQTQDLLSSVQVERSAIYPYSCIQNEESQYRNHPPWGRAMYDVMPDDQEINFGNASHKVLTNLPEFYVAERSDDECNGWTVAGYSEVQSCLHMVKPLMSGSRLWYICALHGGKIGGSGYQFGMDTGDHPTLGHKLMIRYPQEFSVIPTKVILPEWKLATYEEVESNIKLVKSLLKGKKSAFVCLLQGGTLSGEELGFQLKPTEANALVLVDHQIVVKTK
ncbi:kelch-like protein 10 isoform X1 [Amphiura filiformis]|uniref:kelch-like protein 10 isoform X1 n=1 Tax=Amphiura filiformis TaxID=82378 RepID=UPI003B20CAD8